MHGADAEPRSGLRPRGVRVAVDVVLLTLPPESDTERTEEDVAPPGPLVLTVRRDRDPFAGSWALPGAALPNDQDLEAAARSVLTSAGVQQPRHLEQLASFGAPGRDPRGRVVSVSHLALHPEPVPLQDGAQWWAMDAVPPLAFDHSEILATAMARLRGKLSYSTVAYGLLPEVFTFRELQRVYEAVLGHTLDKRNFRKKVTALDLLEPAKGQRRGKHRPAQLYRFRARGYQLLNDVIPT